MTEEVPDYVAANEQVNALRAAIATSIDTLPMNTVEDIEEKFKWSSVGPMSESLYQRLRTILPAGDRTGFDTHHLRAIAGAFQLQDALEGETHELSDVISVIASGLQAGTELKLPSDPTWIEAATLGRALIVLDVYRSPDPRHIAIASAAKRLKDGGANLGISGTGIDTKSPAFQAATEAICERFARLGLLDVLANLCFAARRVQVYEFEQYLFGRRYSLGEREPTIPFGFLFNLAVRVPDAAPTTKNPEKDWHESIQMARDLVAVLNVEPYSQYWMINKSPAHMDHLLIEVGLYDHLFGLRQWPIFVTPLLLENFFGTSHNAKLTAHLGWSATDAVHFGAVAKCVEIG